MKIENRFLKYISFNTQSDPYSTTSPSSKNQLELAEFLIEEMRILGLENVHMSEFGVIYGTIPSNNNHQGDVIGLIAHMDTSPDASGENVHPQIIRNYDGSRISLNEDMVLDPQEFPDLNEVIGHDSQITCSCLVGLVVIITLRTVVTFEGNSNGTRSVKPFGIGHP